MRTQEIKEFESHLSMLNRSYSHYLFVWDQFSIDQADNIDRFGMKLTTEFYSKNTSSKQFNVGLFSLTASHIDAEQLILKSIYLLAYGYFDDYLIQLHKYLQSFDLEIKDLQQRIEEGSLDNNDQIVFDKLLNRLGGATHNHFDEQEILTLDYMRLRRNRIVHRSTTVQGAILTLISQHGAKLNLYWDSHLSKGRYKIDFTRKIIEEFERHELFDLINILRKIAWKVDSLATEKIGRSNLISRIFSIFVESKIAEWSGLSESRKQRMFAAFCKSTFGIAATDEDYVNLDFAAV